MAIELPFDFYGIEVEITEDLLGTVGKSEEMYSYHAGKKAREAAAQAGQELSDDMVAEELATMSSQFIEEKGWTGFHVLDGIPIFYNYVIKGFMKEVCGDLKRSPRTRSYKLSAYKKVINGNVFVFPRRIPLIHPDELPADLPGLERPLRGQTAQGERVALVKSDVMPIGTRLYFELHVLPGRITDKLLHEWFALGQFKGFGQWRNGSYGSFKYTLTVLDEPMYGPDNMQPDIEHEIARARDDAFM